MKHHDWSALIEVWLMTLKYAPKHIEQTKRTIIEIVDNMLREQLSIPSLKPYFTDNEIEDILAGNKLRLIKKVKDRLGVSLSHAKRYVENHGGQILIDATKRR